MPMAAVSEQLAHAQAARLPIAAVAARLQDILGQRLTAETYMVRTVEHVDPT
jgi:hypothetical protein